MRRGIIVLLCISMLALCAACGSANAKSPAPADSASSSQADPDGVPSTFVSTGSSSPDEEPESSIPTSSLSPSATMVQSQDCFDSPYCYRPQEDGTYHFSAVTADEFQGKDANYGSDVITWTVYVLSEEFTDGWRYLNQACQPAIQDLNSAVDIPLKAGEYVYCVCSLNGFTASPAPDNSGTLTITPVQAEFCPGSGNNYQLAVTINSESRCDLDGDGNEDSIYYAVQGATVSADNVWDLAKAMSLVVNGEEFLHPERDNPTDNFGFWMENPDVPYYYIVDLDAGDSYREIALADWGSNDWLTTHYLRHVEGTLVYLGSTAGLPDDHTTVFHGDGSLSALTRLDVMQTWSGVRTYELVDGSLQLKQGEFFQPILSDGWKVTLQRAVTVYDSPSLEAGTNTLQPSADPLSFPSTDGEHWVQLRCTDGTGGWVYFSDSCTLQSGGQSFDASEVFGNLLLAG